MPDQYGIRITCIEWGAACGGADVVGSREEMEALAARWAQQPRHPDSYVTYEVVPYVGGDPASREDVELELVRRTRDPSCTG